MTPIVGLFVVALIEIALAGAVWLRNPRRPVNRWFATFAMTLALNVISEAYVRRARRKGAI